VNVSVRELAVAQGLSASADHFDSAAVAAAAKRHRDYVLQHLTLRVDSRTLAGQVVRVTAPTITAEPEQTFYQYELNYPYNGPPPASVTITQNMLEEWPYALGTSWDVTYIVRLKRSDSNEVTTALLRGRQPTDFPTGWVRPSIWQTFGEYFRDGVMHILNGWDHLLFISALIIATMNFWEMVKVIAAFTLAHTLTLTLSVFNIVRLPAGVVEPLIAASIVFVAVENLVWPRRAHSRLRLGVAFGFGLIHGLGFAGGLLTAMAGMPRIGTWIALVAFSLGVEVGHQLVVLPLFGTLALGRDRLHERFTRPSLRYGSIFIALCGTYYLVVAVRTQLFG
jgi:hypothetical protein